MRELYKAINAGKKEEVAKRIKDGAKLNITEYYVNPMLRAIFNDDIDIMQLLLDAGADINLATEPNRITPMHSACRYNRPEHNELIKILLQKGADINAKTTLGSTPFHYLCDNLHYDNITNETLLIEKGADINAIDEFGMTPLLMAVYNQDIAIVDLLLSKNCNVNCVDIYGETPLSLARNKRNQFIANKLIQAGAKELDSKKEPATNIDKYKNNLWLPTSLVPYHKRFLDTVKPFIKIKAIKDLELSLWQSKFGGYPYLPMGFEYPHSSNGKALFFLAQINFNDLPEIDLFPIEGILLFSFQIIILTADLMKMTKLNKIFLGFYILKILCRMNINSPQIFLSYPNLKIGVYH